MNEVLSLEELITPYGKKTLLVYGGGSIKKNGIKYVDMALVEKK